MLRLVSPPPSLALVAVLACTATACTPFPSQPIPEVADTGDVAADDRGDMGAGVDITTDSASPDTDAPCVPSCGDAECGHDGCGAACGHCELGLACSGRECKAVPWQGLIYRAVGFADGVTGGLDGGLCTVTNVNDDGPGSLRECLGRPPVWVRFGVSGRIVLESALQIPPNTTLDGRGQQVVLAGQTLEVSDAANVILHNLTLDGTTYPQRAAVIVSGDSQKIWLHHISVSRYDGPALEVLGATEITVGWSFFTDVRQGVVIDSGVDSDDLQATLHHNIFRGVEEATPAVRGAQVHLFNNVIEGWDTLGAACFARGQLHSQANSYDSQTGTLAVVTDPQAEGEPGYVRHLNDVAGDNLRLEERQPELVFVPGDFYAYAVQAPDEQLISVVNQQAGYRDEAFPEE
jgi:pectate lyase